MLKDLKKNLNRKNIMAYVVFGAICLVFVFFGYEADNNQLSFAAKVNNKVISINEYRQSHERLKRFYAQMFGGNFDAEQQKRMNIGSRALTELINQEITYQGAKTAGFRVTDSEVAQSIRTIPYFQKDGEFQESYYFNYISQIRSTPSRFEQTLKRDLMVGNFRETFQKSHVASEFEAQKVNALKENQVNISFIKLDPNTLSAVKGSKIDIAKKLEETAFLEKVKAYYDSNPNEFIQSNKAKSFEEAKNSIAAKLVSKDTVDEKINAIKLAYADNKSKATSLATKYGLKWEDTGLFSLDAKAIPKVGDSKEFHTAAFKLSKTGEYAPKVITSTSGDNYIIKLKARKRSAESIKDINTTKENLTYQSFNESYQKWQTDIQKLFAVEKNPNLGQFTQ